MAEKHCPRERERASIWKWKKRFISYEEGIYFIYLTVACCCENKICCLCSRCWLIKVKSVCWIKINRDLDLKHNSRAEITIFQFVKFHSLPTYTFFGLNLQAQWASQLSSFSHIYRHRDKPFILIRKSSVLQHQWHSKYRYTQGNFIGMSKGIRSGIAVCTHKIVRTTKKSDLSTRPC